MIANILREYREELGLSQLEMAQRLGVNYHALRSWETGRRVPSLAELERAVGNDEALRRSVVEHFGELANDPR